MCDRNDPLLKKRPEQLSVGDFVELTNRVEEVINKKLEVRNKQ